LSDDIAFRFSCRDWAGWPLTADKFGHWISKVNGNGFVVNLFLDYETFGEHQWQETGIFDFLRHLPQEIFKHPDNDFKTPSEVIKAYPPVGEVDVPHIVSWADIERDLSAWLGNAMQSNAIHELYRLEKKIRATGDQVLINDWRKLQTSDHFYYMCTKWFSDGDVHKYFNPYDSPYDSYINFMNILGNLQYRLARIPIAQTSHNTPQQQAGAAAN
jgi:alpha-amylase